MTDNIATSNDRGGTAGTNQSLTEFFASSQPKSATQQDQHQKNLIENFIYTIETLAADSFVDALYKPLKATSDDFATFDMNFSVCLKHAKHLTSKNKAQSKGQLALPYAIAWKKYINDFKLSPNNEWFNTKPKYLVCPQNLINSKGRKKNEYSKLSYDPSIDMGKKIDKSADTGEDQMNDDEENADIDKDIFNSSYAQLIEATANEIVSEVSETANTPNVNITTNVNAGNQPQQFPQNGSVAGAIMQSQMHHQNNLALNKVQAQNLLQNNLTMGPHNNFVSSSELEKLYPSGSSLSSNLSFGTSNSNFMRDRSSSFPVVDQGGQNVVFNSQHTVQQPQKNELSMDNIALLLDQKLATSNQSLTHQLRNEMNGTTKSLTQQFVSQLGQLETKIQRTIETTAGKAVIEKFEKEIKPSFEKLEHDSQEAADNIADLQSKVSGIETAIKEGNSLECSIPVENLYSESKRLRHDYEKAVADTINDAILEIHFNNLYLTWNNSRAAIKQDMLGDFFKCKFEIIDHWYRRENKALSANVRILKSSPDDNPAEMAKSIVKRRSQSKGLGINFKTPKSFNCDDDFNFMKKEGFILNYSKGADNKYFIITKNKIKVHPSNPVEFCKLPLDKDFQENAKKAADFTKYFILKGRVFEIPKAKAEAFKKKLNGREFVVNTWEENKPVTNNAQGKTIHTGYNANLTPTNILQEQKLNMTNRASVNNNVNAPKVYQGWQGPIPINQSIPNSMLGQNMNGLNYGQVPAQLKNLGGQSSGYLPTPQENANFGESSSKRSRIVNPQVPLGFGEQDDNMYEEH